MGFVTSLFRKAKLAPPPGPVRPSRHASPISTSAVVKGEVVVEEKKVQVLKDGIGKDEWKGLFPKERLKNLAAS